MIMTDSGAFYALIDRNDINHMKAKNFYEKVAGKETLCTSVPILTEAWLLIDARLGNYFANKVWKMVIVGILEIIDCNRDDLEAALKIENKYPEAGFGFIDSTCFALCEKYRIRRVFTFDRKHFSIYKPGFSKFLELLP